MGLEARATRVPSVCPHSCYSNTMERETSRQSHVSASLKVSCRRVVQFPKKTHFPCCHEYFNSSKYILCFLSFLLPVFLFLFLFIIFFSLFPFLSFFLSLTFSVFLFFSYFSRFFFFSLFHSSFPSVFFLNLSFFFYAFFSFFENVAIQRQSSGSRGGEYEEYYSIFRDGYAV
jgi:hypothetical protein